MRFKSSPSKSLTLKDIVAIYRDGKNYKIIPLSIANKQIVIYDNYHDKTYQNKGKLSAITFTYCPYTSSAVVYFGKYSLYKEKKNKNNIILQDNDNKDRLLIQLTGDIIHADTGKLINIDIRKTEVKLMTFRNAVSKYPDALYLHSKNKEEPVILKEKIVYGIEYELPDKDFIKKYSVIIGKDDGIDYIKSAYDKYFNAMYEKVIEKGGFVTPCYLSAWLSFHPETKQIVL